LDKFDAKIRKLQQDDLERVLAWRNHPEIRRYMYTQHEITWDEHLNWYLNKKDDPKTHLLIFELNQNPEGFVSFCEKNCPGTAEWGFYVAPNAPKKIGYLLGVTALDYAFKMIGMHKVCGQALIYNKKSIKFHISLGFQQEAILRKHHFDGLTYYDVISFALLADVWNNVNLKGAKNESSKN
jgi:UDP-4-amino-4,6-dideoxy-N-acetyl-beta-L-altrosamine N-acetyltransferase